MAKYLKTEEGYKTVEEVGIASTESVEAAQLAANNAQSAAEIQSDWYQKDETQVDYIKNRTHYTEDREETFNLGTVQSREVLPMSPVSNGGLIPDELFNAMKQDIQNCVFKSNDDTIRYTKTETINSDKHHFFAFDGVNRFIVYEPFMNSLCLEIHNTFGLNPPALNNLTLEYTFIDGTVHQLDEKFIPNTIARVVDITVPTKTSELDNDSGFITEEDVPSVYAVPYYDSPTEEQKTEIIAAMEAIKADSGAYSVVMTIGLYDAPAEVMVTDAGAVTLIAMHNHTDESHPTKYVLKLTTAGGIQYWSEEMPTFSGSYNDLTDTPTIPSKTSQLTNDSNFLTSIPSEYVTEEELETKKLATETFVTNKIAEAALEGNDVDLSGYATKDDIKDFITEVPSEYITETELNAKGYLTQHQDLSDYAKTEDVPTKLSELTEDSTHRVVTDVEKTAWSAKSNFSGSYNDLTDKPTIPTVPTKLSEFDNDKGYLTSYTETDPTVSAWAKEPNKPSYTKAEIGLGNVDNVKQYSDSNPPPYPVTSVNGKTGAVSLSAGDVGALPSTYTPPDQTAAQVGADPKGTADSKVSTHNTSDTSHNDIRLLIEDLTTRLNTLANSTDADLDQLSEVVAYIKANRTLIESITTSKVSVSDIVNNLTTNVTNKPLSAAQGVALKALIDAIKVPTKLSELTEDTTHRVVTDTEKNAWNAKSDFSGKYADLEGKPTIPSKTSQLDNDSGFLTQHQSLSGYAKTADHYTKTESDDKYQPKGDYLTSVPSEYVTETELANKKYLTSVPSEYVTETELNAKGYLTQHQDLSSYAKKSEIPTVPTKVSVFTNDAGYVKNTELNSALDSKADMSEGAFYIEGSGTTDSTAKTSTWVGTSDRITEYYDGLTIRYKIGVEGQSTVTLNINNLGAKTVYRFSTTKLTTQFPVGSIIHLIYHTDLNDGCWITNDYDANTNTQQRVYVTTTNKEYPITARYNNTTGETYYAEYGRYSTGVTLNPSTNTITATAFKGKLTGNADTATKATQDASGNVIVSTYVNKNDISLGIASDGLMYVFVDGDPVGTGIPQGAGGEQGDLFGYIDENNTVVLKGDLADGTYNIKYEMEDGEIVNIGNLVLDSTVYYSVTSNLTNCTSNNSIKQIAQGESYSATITANSGYELKSVTATMGGSAVTVTNGKINIASVTDNIVITAVAEVVKTETNFAEYNSTNTSDWSIWINNARAGSDGTYRSDTYADGYGTPAVSNYIAVQNGDTIEFTGMYAANKNALLCDSAKKPLSSGGAGILTNLTANLSNISLDNNNWTGTFTINNSTIAYVRIGGYVGMPNHPVSDISIKIKRNGVYL